MNNQQLNTSLQEIEQLTKKEKYLFKKEKKKQERFGKERRKRNKKIIGISLLLLAILIIGGLVFGINNYLFKQKESNLGIAKIEISPREYDAGTVSMADGLVKHTYELKSIGQGDLKISNIRTSCMCTTAVLRIGENKSPEFGMHNNPAFWSQKIAPGESGFLEISFDPAFHGPQGTGSAIREVYFSTNDSQNKNLKIRLLVNVIE